jgi:hypothetical protein
MKNRHQAGRFTSETPDAEEIRNAQTGWIWEKKRRESLSRTYEQYDAARALLAEWEAVPATTEAIAEIKRLRKKIQGLSSRLRYKGCI